MDLCVSCCNVLPFPNTRPCGAEQLRENLNRSQLTSLGVHACGPLRQVVGDAYGAPSTTPSIAESQWSARWISISPSRPGLSASARNRQRNPRFPICGGGADLAYLTVSHVRMQREQCRDASCVDVLVSVPDGRLYYQI
ncbi:hypothetical protein A0H81_10174 [Grifola frondosa]|uniref:Uncharacterized protein n=1 Tax=Grifola frondosa TaxID=5627 RepID=A0A1C7M3M3_GRIFR|nr:hypothetical protein A0H81_10174 [Grifola frondosa]